MSRHIRLAERRDFHPVAALLTELGRPALTPETVEAAQKVYERHLADENSASLVAEVDGTVVGFVSLLCRDHLNYIAPQGWIPDLIVTASARGMGVSRALLEEAFSQAGAHGCDRVRLESGYARTVAHKVYGAVGMSNDGYYFTKPYDHTLFPLASLFSAAFLPCAGSRPESADARA